MIQAGVIGVGQTNYDSKRRDVSMAGLSLGLRDEF